MTVALCLVRRRLVTTAAVQIGMCLLSVFPVWAQAGSCGKSAPVYEQQGYVVNSVSVSTGLEWLPAVRQSLQPIVQSLPLKPRRLGAGGDVIDPGNFHVADYFAGQEIVRDKFPELQVSRQARIAGRIAWSSLQNCDPSKKTLDVVYRVYTLGLPTFNSFVYEAHDQPLKSAVPDNKSTALLTRLQVQPQLGYNGSRKLFGGSTVTARFKNPVIQDASATVLGSSQSLTASAELSGQQQRPQARLAQSEWKLQFLHSDVPVAVNKTSQNLLAGQFVLGTAPITANELIFRFGGAMEGGNKQSNFAPASVATSDVASASYGAAKLFAGTSWRAGRHTFKESYGIKLGATDGVKLDYARQIMDFGQSFRFYPVSHRELKVDTAFTYGRIDVFGQLPVTERFFGGNAEQNFTSTESWLIQSNPFIRNFAENQFLLHDSSGAIAGNRFFSANATIAFNVWRYPLVPAEVEQDPDFRANLNRILSASQGLLVNEYIAGTDDFRALAQQLGPLSQLMDKAHVQLKTLESPGNTTVITEALGSASDAANDVDKAIAKARQDDKDGELSISDIQDLTGIEPDEPGGEPELSYLLDLASALDDLKIAITVANPVANVTDLDNLIRDCRGAHVTLYTAFVKAIHSPAAKAEEQRAAKDMAYSRRVVGEVFDTANLVAVSPVLMFDSGQISQAGKTGTGIRYGVGTGVKISVFALDFTAGYSWNIHRRLGEGGGAFVLNLAVGDLFR